MTRVLTATLSPLALNTPGPELLERHDGSCPQALIRRKGGLDLKFALGTADLLASTHLASETGSYKLHPSNFH